MRYSFKHCNGLTDFKRGTIFINLPDKKFLEDDLFKAHGSQMLARVGAARLAPGAQYIKSLGREYALSMSDWYPASFVSVDIRGTKHVYHFSVVVKNQCPKEPNTQVVEFGISTIAESDNTQLVYAFFKE